MTPSHVPSTHSHALLIRDFLSPSGCPGVDAAVGVAVGVDAVLARDDGDVTDVGVDAPDVDGDVVVDVCADECCGDVALYG